MEFLIGLTVDDARKELRKLSSPIKQFYLAIAKLDGESCILTDDCLENKIYVAVENKCITKVWIHRELIDNY
jgi:hypothetical protein